MRYDKLDMISWDMISLDVNWKWMGCVGCELDANDLVNWMWIGYDMFECPLKERKDWLFDCGWDEMRNEVKLFDCGLSHLDYHKNITD